MSYQCIAGKHIYSMHSSLIARAAYVISVTISKAIVIRNFISLFLSRVICLSFCTMRCNLCEREEREKTRVIVRSRISVRSMQSRRVMAYTTLKLTRISRRLPGRYLAKRIVDGTSLIAPSNSTATPINKYKRPPFADSIVSEDKSWAHTLAES